MKKNKVFFLVFFSIFFFSKTFSELITDIFYLPIDVENRRVLKSFYINPEGDFGIWRKPYKGIKGHYHTGIDFKNPGSKKGALEPIFSCGIGIVKSVIKNGPSSTVIIEHTLRNNKKVYSVYLHISDIMVNINDTVDEKTVLGSFIDYKNLDKWGEFLNHLHFEMLKVPPKFVGFDRGDSIFNSYSINIKRKDEIDDFYFDPKIFFIRY
ncbi:MAG: M23 family metallopeptidase [candidate division WOR-3 bacterium]